MNIVLTQSYNRVYRVANEIKRNLSVIFQFKIKDPRMLGNVIVLEVNLSKDLSYAKVFITFFYKYTQKQLAENMKILHSASGCVRYLLSKSMFFRSVPQLFFVYIENSCVESIRVYRYLSSIMHVDSNISQL